MITPIYVANPDMNVIVKEWGSWENETLYSGPVRDIPDLDFKDYTIGRIEARIEEDMSEIQYYSIELVKLRK